MFMTSNHKLWLSQMIRLALQVTLLATCMISKLKLYSRGPIQLSQCHACRLYAYDSGACEYDTPEISNTHKPPSPITCRYDIMLACWAARPKDRPTFTEIRKMLDALLDTGEYTSLLSLSVSQNAVIGLETIMEGHESAS